MVNQKSKVVSIKGKSYVNDLLVAEADFMVAIVDKPKNDKEQ